MDMDFHVKSYCQLFDKLQKNVKTVEELFSLLKEQMQEHPGMGLQAIWHRYHSEQVTKDTDPAVAAFHKEKPQPEKRGFCQRLFGKK